MIYFKMLRTTALLTTTLLGSIPFAHGMEAEEKGPTKYTKIYFTGIEVEPTKELSIQEVEKGSFRKLASFEEARDAVKLLSDIYNTLPGDNKIPFIKLGKHPDQSIYFKQKFDEDSFRILTPADANTTLQSMLDACKKAALNEKHQQPDADAATTEEDPESAQRLKSLRDAVDEDRKCEVAAAALRQQQEATARLEAETTGLQQEETARIQAETIREQQENAVLRAEFARQQKAQAEEVLRQEREENARLREALRLQQEVTAQAETQRREQETATQAQLAAQAEALRLQQEAAAQAEEQRKLVIFGGRTPERVEHNIHVETARAVQGVSNLLMGKKWSKKHKK